MTNDLRGALERLTNVADSVVTQHATSSVRPGSMVVLADAVTIARQALSAPVGDEGRLCVLADEINSGRCQMTGALATAYPDSKSYDDALRAFGQDLAAALSQPSPDGGGERPTAAIENLTNCQRQLDMDGCHVGVSRQALVEVLAYVAPLPPLASGEGKGRLGAERLHVAHDPAAKPSEGGE